MSLTSVNLVWPMPLSTEFGGFSLIRSYSLWDICVSSYDKVLSFVAKLRNPVLILIAPSNPFMSAHVFVDLPIPLVLLASGKPEVRNSVVTGVAVNVVHNKVGPVSMVDCPYYPTGKVNLPQDADCDYPVLSDRSRYSTGFHASSGGSAFKQARFRVVSELRQKRFLAYFRIFDSMHEGPPDLLEITRVITPPKRVCKGDIP